VLRSSALGRPVPVLTAVALPRARVTEGAVVFAVALAGYLVAASVLVFVAETMTGDAWSRVGNALYVIGSRDPHLAAIGFVWPPLPSILVMPLLLVRDAWPALVSEGFAANLVSAVAMAGAVYQLRGTLMDWAVPGPSRIGLTALFALHPLIIETAANGETEAVFVLLLIMATRSFAAWLRFADASALVFAGVLIALIYLTRYEGLAVAAGAVLLTAGVTYQRTPGDRRARVVGASADALIVGTPFIAAFAAWAVVSWIIVGNPFETFASIYGSSSQLQLGAEITRERSGQGSAGAVSHAARQVLGLAPALIVLVPIGIAVSLARRDRRSLAVLGLLGATVCFSLWTFFTGRSFGWLRFYVIAIPMAILLSGLIIASVARMRQRFLASVLRIAMVAIVAVGLPAAAVTVTDPLLAPEEANRVASIVTGTPIESTPGTARYRTGGEIARYLDALALPDGSVLVDTWLGFPTVLRSSRPLQFVITSDRDFSAAVTDPSTFGVTYLLVPEPAYLGSVDALNRTYPELYSRGAGIGTLQREFRASTSWRLYKVAGGTGQ